MLGVRDVLGDRYRREIENNYRWTVKERERATRRILNPGFAQDDSSWVDQAACRRAPDPEIFFPVGNEVKTTEPWLEFCNACPVRRECGDFATARHLEGVWGGTWRVPKGRSAALRGRPRHKGTPMDSEAVRIVTGPHGEAF